MKKQHHYLAYADTGRDFIEFEFVSFYRANSKANKDDAQKEYKTKHGRNIKIIQTTLLK